MHSVIQLQGVTKSYGAQKALDDVTLQVPPGVVFALLGENGAGKTTAIRVLLGLTAPDRGTATVLGLDSARQGQAVRGRVGYVPERPTLYEWMTIGEIGWFTAGFYGSGFLQRYLKLAAEYQLPPGRKIKALSKGMRAKVSLALKANYIITRRYLFGDVGAQEFLFGQNAKDHHLTAMLWPRLLPWESYRGLRQLNEYSAEYLDRLRRMRKSLADGEGVVDFLPLLPNYYSPEDRWSRYEGWGEYLPEEPSALAGTLTPELRSTRELISFLSLTLPAFEARRRGAIIVLTAEAYRREHGTLPASLDELGELPRDPYSGKPFVYYPQGLPTPATPLEEIHLRRVRQFVMPAPLPGWPCVWCTGPFLWVAQWPYDELIDVPSESQDKTTSGESKAKPKPVEFHRLRQYDWVRTALPSFIAWGRGTWFPIPAQPAQ